MELMLFTNRVTLFLLLGSIVIVGYAWKSFKPRDGELPEYSYKPLSIKDLPDIPIDAECTLMSRETGSSPAVGFGLRAGGSGVYKPGELRTTDIEDYRQRVEYYREMKRKSMGLTAQQVHEREAKRRIKPRTIYMALAVATIIGVAGLMAIRQNHLMRQEYITECLSGFEIIEVGGGFTPSSSEGTEQHVKLLNVQGIEFTQIARQQNVTKIYHSESRD